MDQVTKVRKSIKREQWKTLVKECQSSGMTVSAWCSANNICTQTYYRNFRKLREELCENLPNATLEINDGASQQTVQAVLLALQSIC